MGMNPTWALTLLMLPYRIVMLFKWKRTIFKEALDPVVKKGDMLISK